MLAQACTAAEAWRARCGHDIRIAVNLSPAQFHHRQDLAELVAATLRDSQLPASLLELEITEGVLLQHTDANLVPWFRSSLYTPATGSEESSMGSPRLKALELGEAERAALEALAVRRRTAQGLALRARIVLACAEMGSPRLVGARLAVHPDTVRKWRHRFAEHRLDGLRDEPRWARHARSATSGSRR